MPVELHPSGSVAASHSLGSGIAHARARWGWFAALGVAFILFGAIAFGSLAEATVAKVLIIGVVMMLGGISEIVMGLRMRNLRRLVLLCVAGALLVVAGILCYLNPFLAAAALTLMLGASLCAAGLVRIYVASQMGEEAPWRIAIFSGLITFIVGVIILAGWPVNSVYVLGLFLAIDLTLYGAAFLGLAFRLRSEHRTG